jgi:UDP-N-acetyl-D-mannosaminuronate dehydrogenase
MPHMKEEKPQIGFIGQGFIGKSYADDFEKRGFPVVRYGLQPEYAGNKDQIAECDVVFVAVNAATVPTGEAYPDGYPKVRYDDSNVRGVISLTKPGAIVVIKSTLPPGMTKALQEEHPDRIVLHAPEFLLETTAAKDASSPERNIIGIPKGGPEHRAAAERVLAMLPEAPFAKIVDATDAEFIKYGGNAFLNAKIVFANMLFELVSHYGGDWETIREAIGADPRVGPSHMDLRLNTTVHGTEDPKGVYRRRGAGRSCFIKDWAELTQLYSDALPHDTHTIEALRGFAWKNAELLREYDRYVDLLEGVYGKGMGERK